MDTNVPVTPTVTVPPVEFSATPQLNGGHVSWYYTYPQYEAINGRIGVEPFTTDAVVKVGTKSAFATMGQKTQLTPLVVVFGTKEISAGWTVFVPGDLCASQDAKKVYEIDGKSVIFLPVNEIKLVRKYLYPLTIQPGQQTWTAKASDPVL
jgi:hypothetical protein